MSSTAKRGVIKSSIVLSLLIIICLSIVMYITIKYLFPEIDINKESNEYFIITLAFLLFLELFLLILIGNIVEYFRKEPELLTLSMGVVIPLYLAYTLDLYKSNIKTAITIGAFLGIALYVLVARED